MLFDNNARQTGQGLGAVNSDRRGAWIICLQISRLIGKGGKNYENDIPAPQQAEIPRTRLPEKDVHEERAQGSGQEKGKGQMEIDCPEE